MVRCDNRRVETGIVESEERRRAELMECVGISWDFGISVWAVAATTSSRCWRMVKTPATWTRQSTGNLLLLLGVTTPLNSMSGSIYGSHLFPEQWDKVKANRDLIPNAVAEIIRWQTPLAYMRRTALKTSRCTVKPSRRQSRDVVRLW